MVSRSDIGGHPIAIRVGGRRLSHSNPSSSKAPQKSGTSPDDPQASTSPTMSASGDYPRPEHNTVRPETGGGGHEDQQQEESHRRKKKHGFNNNEAKNMVLNNAGSATGRAPRRTAASHQQGGARIQQPARGLAL